MVFCRSVSFEYEILVRVKCTKFSWVAGEDRLTEIDENIQMEIFRAIQFRGRGVLGLDS